MRLPGNGCLMTRYTRRPFTVVSGLPNRMRLKGRFLRDPNLDPDYLKATLETIPGVESARLNGRASFGHCPV